MGRNDVAVAWPEGTDHYTVTATNGAADLYASNLFLSTGYQSYTVTVSLGDGLGSGETATSGGATYVKLVNNRLRLGAQQVHVGADGQFNLGSVAPASSA